MLEKKKPTIALIDSGIGGISVLKALLEKYKAGNYIYFADNRYMPYGNKSKQIITSRINYLINYLFDNYKVDIIIIACNTASSVIDNKNDVYKLNFDENYTYLTTKLTKENLNNPNIIADKTLATAIENNIFNHKKLKRIISKHIKTYNLNKLNSFVLGCTHFELVYDIFKELCPNTNIIKNSQNLVNNVDFSPDTTETTILFLQSKNSLKYITKLKKLIRG